jgi:hypothetical protein
MSTVFSGQEGDSQLGRAALSSEWKYRPLLLIFTACVAIEVTLVLLDLTVNWLKWSDTGAIRRLFNITREDGLASFFGIMQTAAVAVTLWLTWFLVRQHKSSSVSLNSAGWLMLAIFLTYIAIDDGAMVHERIGTAFSRANAHLSLPTYGWQFVMGPLFAVMGIAMIGFLWRQGSAAVRRDWLIAAFSCMAIAVGLDYIEGMEDGYRLLIDQTGWRTKTIAHFSKSIEEFLEMLGMSILLILFLRHLTYLASQVEIRIAGGKISVTPAIRY